MSDICRIKQKNGIYQVKRLIGELTERSITSNSTSKISNLVFEWNLECKQELIKIFKDLIG